MLEPCALTEFKHRVPENVINHLLQIQHIELDKNEYTNDAVYGIEAMFFWNRNRDINEVLEYKNTGELIEHLPKWHNRGIFTTQNFIRDHINDQDAILKHLFMCIESDAKHKGNFRFSYSNITGYNWQYYYSNFSKVTLPVCNKFLNLDGMERMQVELFELFGNYRLVYITS